VLNKRLAELREAGVVVHDGSGYALTGEGETLLELLSPLARWSDRWAERSRR
jgi:DNA-binding HxlR family transcriptional regulator